MFAPKDYLLFEWANVEQTLRETLRFRYVATARYYSECSTRLTYLHHLIETAPEDDTDTLDRLMLELDYLAGLITSIERSHLEEFSWPFAQALERIAEQVCDALFFFGAEGGTCSYAVLAENELPSTISQRINSVVFPRILKDSVLLHAILGHEIGHAIVAAHPAKCREIITTLISKSVVADPNELFHWCEANLGVTERRTDDYLIEQADSWGEEFLCDIFGLIIMGPSFLPAFQSLLEIRSFGGVDRVVPSHPPFESRIIALLHSARALDMFYSANQESNSTDGLSRLLDQSFIEVAERLNTNSAIILDLDQVMNAARDLAAFAGGYAGLCSPVPDGDLLAQLIQCLRDDIPPSGSYPSVTPSGADEFSISEAQVVDFREILLAGWLFWSEVASAGEEKFRDINRFCSHAILQQEGLIYWTNRLAQIEAATT